MAIFQFTERSEIAVVCAVGDGHSRDVLAVVFRDAAGAPWHVDDPADGRRA